MKMYLVMLVVSMLLPMRVSAQTVKGKLVDESNLEKYNEWLNDPAIDEETKKELRSIKDDESEIQDRFYMENQWNICVKATVIVE